MTVRFLSLFSGVDAASLAWEQLGWECVAFSEIESFPCEVLRQRWPHVPNLGDVTKITEEQIAALGRIDVVVFGSPCQDLSLAGKRKGFDGERSGLFFDAMRVVRYARRWNGCRFALWENVFGAFSSNEGRDFAAVVAEMAGLDHVEPPSVGKKTKWGNEGCAVGDEGLLEWATLDAQWFGVAQRRRRVFALADFGDWANRPPILLERESLRGDSAPSRQPWETIAGTLTCRLGEGFQGQDAYTGLIQVAFGGNRTSGPIEICPALLAQPGSGWKGDFESETFIIYDLHQVTNPLNVQARSAGDPCHALTKGSAHNVGCVSREGVRRLTPLECERLQGFPDNHTNIAVRGKPAADGPRYKAIGNSKAVPVIKWIGHRIDFVLKYF